MRRKYRLTEAELILEFIKEVESRGFEVVSRYGNSKATKKRLREASP
jgi:hypothetical protein